MCSVAVCLYDKAWQQHGFVTLNTTEQHQYVTLPLAGQFVAVTLAQAMIKVINKVNDSTMQAA